jgi:hypothetical protein
LKKITIFVYLTNYISPPDFRVRVRVMVFNATFNIISVITWYSVLLVEDLDFRYRTFINIQLNESEYLVHGHRYTVCVHAATTEIQHEKWTEILDEVNSCSDGVTVDLTPPVSM